MTSTVLKINRVLTCQIIPTFSFNDRFAYDLNIVVLKLGEGDEKRRSRKILSDRDNVEIYAYILRKIERLCQIYRIKM